MNTQNLLKQFERALKENNLELVNLLKLDADTIRQLKEWEKCRKCCLNMSGLDAAFYQFLYNTPQFGSINILGRPHKTVIIGAQEWMAENLFCPELGWYYDNDHKNSEGGYGTLHSHHSLPAIQAELPSGWRVATDPDWDALFKHVEKDAGKKLKSKEGWANGGNGADDYGFRVLPAGLRNDDGSFFNGRGYAAFFWSSSAGSASIAWIRYFNYSRADVVRVYYGRSCGLSVRCIRDLK